MTRRISRNILKGSALALAVLSARCSNEKPMETALPLEKARRTMVEKREISMPIPTENQRLFLYPDHPKAEGIMFSLIKAHYALLTDLDGDGKEDIAEEYTSIGKGPTKVYFKKGYGPGRSVNIDMEYVDPDFFKSWEKK